MSDITAATTSWRKTTMTTVGPTYRRAWSSTLLLTTTLTSMSRRCLTTVTMTMTRSRATSCVRFNDRNKPIHYSFSSFVACVGKIYSLQFSRCQLSLKRQRCLKAIDWLHYMIHFVMLVTQRHCDSNGPLTCGYLISPRGHLVWHSTGLDLPPKFRTILVL